MPWERIIRSVSIVKLRFCEFFRLSRAYQWDLDSKASQWKSVSLLKVIFKFFYEITQIFIAIIYSNFLAVRLVLKINWLQIILTLPYKKSKKYINTSHKLHFVKLNFEQTEEMIKWCNNNDHTYYWWLKFEVHQGICF